MKKLKSLVVLIILVAIFPGDGFSQKTDNKGLVFDTLICDLGILDKGSNAECHFSFVNKADKAVIITNVKASCGCTVPQWPRKPMNTGEKGVITVKYNTAKTGAFVKTIKVFTSPGNEEITLTLKGEVIKKKSSSSIRAFIPPEESGHNA